MAPDDVGCGHSLVDRFWAGETSFLCLRCLDRRLQDLRNVELLDKDLRNLNTCLRQGNTALLQRLCVPRPNGSATGTCLIKRILVICASLKPLSATGYKTVVFVLLAFAELREVPRTVLLSILPHISKMPKECRNCVIHLIAKTEYSVEELAPHARAILENADSNMTRAVIGLIHDLVVNDLSLVEIYIRKLLRLVKREEHSIGTQNVLKGLLFAARTTPEVFIDRRNAPILEALNPFMTRRQSEIVCGILYIIVNNGRVLDLFIANDVPFRLAELALTCVNVDCAKIFLNCLGDLFKVENGRAFTPNSASRIFSVLLVLQEVTFDADVALSLLHLLTSLIDCKQFRGMRKAEGDLLLAQLDALCQRDVPEIGTAALKCFGCSLVTDKLPPDVSFDRCLNMFAKCIRAFEKEKITLEHFVDCATEFSKWSVCVKNESQQRTLLPVEFVPDWIDNFVLELLERLLSHNASKLTRRRVLVLLKNSLELVGSDRSPKHWEACLKLSWALVEREMDSAEARAFIATFISTLSPTTEASFENARYLQTSVPVDLESTQDEIVACLILYNTAAHFLPHRDPPPMERLLELIESIIRCGFRWRRRENLVGAIRLLVGLLPSGAGNPIRGPLRKLILFLPPDILRECLSSLANSETTRRLIFEDEDRSFEKLANLVIEKLCSSKKIGALITAAETGSARISELIMEAVFSFDVLGEFIHETKSRAGLPESLIECLFRIVAAYRDRNSSQVLKTMQILDVVISDTDRFHHKLLLMAKALMEIYSVEQLTEIPPRFLRIVEQGFDIRSFLISESEQILLHSFLTTVTHNDWLTGLELFLELRDKIPQFPLSFSWNEMEAYLRTRGRRCDLVLKAVALSFGGNPCLIIEPSVDLRFTRDFCSDCLETTDFDQPALDVLLRMEYLDKWYSASFVALARTELSSNETSKRVTAQLLNQCLEFYRIEWINSVIEWFTQNANEIGEGLWSDFVTKVENLTDISLVNPCGVDLRSATMTPAQHRGVQTAESAPT